ncbi:A-kinase-interacting protein 1 [Polymixia lowei]
MGSRACLEETLRRSATLGLEVLHRASRRSVDWTSITASGTPTADEDEQNSVERTHTHLDDAFETIAEFMAQTTYKCKDFYGSNYCTEPSDVERTHVSRFHTHPTTRTTTLPTRHGRKPVCEDFHIEVSPGTYAITAGMPDSRQQTQLVSVNAGESVNLTFNL